MASKIVYISKLGVLLERIIEAFSLPEIRHEQMSLSGQNNCVVRVVHKTDEHNEIIPSVTLRNENSAVARVEIWHAKNVHPMNFSVPTRVNPDDYSLVGVLVLPDTPELLSQAFDNSNNIVDAWQPLKDTRSTMVGDVFVVRRADGTSNIVRVASFGFSPVSFNE